MIANICAILLCCFAINIKTIESAGNQIAPILINNRRSDESYICTVNILKTFNKHSINIKPADVDILSSLDCDTNKKYQLKLRSRVKLETKGRDINCSFAVIAISHIPYLKNLVENLTRGEPFDRTDEEFVKRLEEEAKIILSILLLGDLKTGEWLWMYFLKVVAIRKYDENKRFIGENPFEDIQLQTGVSDFIRNCMGDKYLPSTALDSNFVSKNKKISDNLFSVLRESGLVWDVTNNCDLVMIEFLYLCPFWFDDGELLFRQIVGVNIDWSESKRRHEAEVAITNEFLENHSWIYKPYDRLEHQHLLIKIINATFYCYFSVLLYVFEKQLFILVPQLVVHIKRLICEAMERVLEITAFKDEFLMIIYSELKLANITHIKDITARVRIKANEILNDLNRVGTRGFDRLNFIVDEGQLSNHNFIMRLIEYFNHYLDDLISICKPFDYKMLLNFMDEVKMTADQ